MQDDSSKQDGADHTAAPVSGHAKTLDLPEHERMPRRPSNVTHLSTPAYESPLRHHRRQPSAPHQVKETLHARSEYTNADGDGAAIHRINQYVIKQEIGRGSFGAVHLAVDHQGNEYAVKEFSKSRLRKRAQSNILRRPHGPKRSGHLEPFNKPLHRRSASEIHDDEGGGSPLHLIQQEIAIMKKLNHDNLVSLFEVLDDPAEDSLYMVLEMCKKGVVMKVGMNEMADPYEPESCRCWFRDLVLGIEYLHAQGVCHRDIKPDNLLLTHDDVLKIVDFGVSEMFEKHSDMTTAKAAGSPAFLPPELCVSHHGSISGKAADVWSMGVTLHCLHFGRVPFEQTGVLELYESIKNDDIEIGPCDEDFHDLIRRMLEKDPARRISIPEIREHPWVTKRGTDPLLSAEENTADLVEEPTAEEVNKAISTNFSKVLVTLKAVRKFKSLLNRRRPRIIDDSFGHDLHLTQSPPAMDSRADASPSSTQPPANHYREEGLASRPSIDVTALHHKAYSEDSHDRRPVEQALVRDGVHRRINADLMTQHPPEREDPSTFHRPLVASPTDVESSAKARGSGGSTDSDKASPAAGKRDISAHPEKHRARSSQEHGSSPKDSRQMSPLSPGKGHAHDPLEEFLFLSVGPGKDYERSSTADAHDPNNDATNESSDSAHLTHDGDTADKPTLVASRTATTDDAEPPCESIIVSESPPAASEDIFSLAYRNEVSRIRSQTENATVYLTRRVDGSGGKSDEDEKDGKRGATEPKAGAPKLAEMIRGIGAGKRGKEEGE